MLGLPSPSISSMATLEKLLKGVKSVQARGGRQQRTRLPITPTILRKLRVELSPEEKNPQATMLWAVCSLCFFGFFRAGELTLTSSQFDERTHLSYKDVAVDNVKQPSLLRIHLKASKTDPFRQGVDVFVGATGNELCPVTAVTQYLAIRGGSDGPLFRWKDGTPVKRDQFVVKVRDTLQRAGIQPSLYAGHSFRSGAATTAAACGINDATIKMLGRWKSNAYQVYVKTPRDSLAAISRTLAS